MSSFSTKKGDPFLSPTVVKVYILWPESLTFYFVTLLISESKNPSHQSGVLTVLLKIADRPGVRCAVTSNAACTACAIA